MQCNIDINSIVDQRDWVRTRRTYYKMRKLFLDWRKNNRKVTARAHAVVRRDVRVERVLRFKRICAFPKLKYQMSPPRGEHSNSRFYPMDFRRMAIQKNVERLAEVWLFNW